MGLNHGDEEQRGGDPMGTVVGEHTPFRREGPMRGASSPRAAMPTCFLTTEVTCVHVLYACDETERQRQRLF